jgi:hypothetical protein
MKPFDAQGAFAPFVPGGGDDLRRLTVKSAGVTVFTGGIGLAVQMVGTVILARLIAPRDYGLVTMVTTFSILLVGCGGSSGVPDAVAQCKRIDHTLASNLFWITVGIGTLLTLAFASAGSLLAMFFGEPALVTLAVGISATIFLTSISVMHLALLRRDRSRCQGGGGGGIYLLRLGWLGSLGAGDGCIGAANQHGAQLLGPMPMDTWPPPVYR